MMLVPMFMFLCIISDTCLEVCEYNGYECYDNVLEDTHCPSAALKMCGSSSIKDQSHAYQCDKGGCYVDCNSGVYADRGQSYLTCYSSPICHAPSKAYGFVFTKICTCAIVTSTPPMALRVYMWELLGMAALLLFAVGAAVTLLHYYFPGIFPTWDGATERLGLGKSSPSLTERISGCVGRVAEFATSIFESMSNAVLSSYSNLADTSTSKASEERRRRRERRNRRKHGDSNELDVSQDMQIG